MSFFNSVGNGLETIGKGILKVGGVIQEVVSWMGNVTINRDNLSRHPAMMHLTFEVNAPVDASRHANHHINGENRKW